MDAKAKIQAHTIKIFQNKELNKERTDENKMLADEISMLFDEIEDEFVEVELPNGKKKFVQRERSIKDKTDKAAIANEIGVEKNDLKTPYHFSKLTKQGKLEPEVIAKHIYPEEKEKIKFAGKKPKKD